MQVIGACCRTERFDAAAKTPNSILTCHTGLRFHARSLVMKKANLLLPLLGEKSASVAHSPENKVYSLDSDYACNDASRAIKGRLKCAMLTSSPVCAVLNTMRASQASGSSRAGGKTVVVCARTTHKERALEVAPEYRACQKSPAIIASIPRLLATCRVSIFAGVDNNGLFRLPVSMVRSSFVLSLFARFSDCQAESTFGGCAIRLPLVPPQVFHLIVPYLSVAACRTFWTKESRPQESTSYGKVLEPRISDFSEQIKKVAVDECRLQALQGIKN